MINRIFSGTRCRVIRQVRYPGGSVHRFTLGTIRYAMENLGRDLVMVDWDTGQATVVFPRDIEIVAADHLAATAGAAAADDEPAAACDDLSARDQTAA